MPRLPSAGRWRCCSRCEDDGADFACRCIRPAAAGSICVMSPYDHERPMNRTTALRNATAGFVVATLALVMLHMLLA